VGTQSFSAECSTTPLISALGRGQGFAAGSCEVNEKEQDNASRDCYVAVRRLQDRNYSTTKNKKTTTARLEFSKFCRKCRKHTPHKEVK